MSSEAVGGYGRAHGWGAKRFRSGSKSPARKVSKYVTKRQLPALVMEAVNKKAETKHKFHEFKSATADNTGTVYHLSSIDDGVNDLERVGENIMVTGVDISGYFNNDETNETSLCRLIVFRAREAVPSTPSPSLILATIGDTRTPVSLYNIDNIHIGVPGSNRAEPAYTIFYDKVFAVGDEGGNVTKKPFRVSIRLKRPLPCNFIGNEDTDEGPGQWYMMWVSNVTAPSTTVQLNADARIYYTDV